MSEGINPAKWIQTLGAQLIHFNDLCCDCCSVQDTDSSRKTVTVARVFQVWNRFHMSQTKKINLAHTKFMGFKTG